MRTKITILIVGIALIAGCSNSEEKAIEVVEPVMQETETQDNSPTRSLLDENDEIIDYRDKYTTPPPDDPRWIEFGSYRSHRPSTWFWVAPKSSFTICNYIVPGVEGNELANFTISQFEKGQGGDLTTNLKRWKSKFNTHNGAPVIPIIQTIQINGKESTAVEFRGEYMGAGAAWHRPDQTLLIAIYEDIENTYYFKLLGPTLTIEAHRDSLFTFLANLEHA